jgi:hypothetical protein
LIWTQSEQVQGQRYGGDLLDFARCSGFGQNQAVGVFAELFEIARPQLAGPFDFYWIYMYPAEKARGTV